MENLDEYEYIDFDDKLLKDKAYDFILNSCDEVEFLSEYKMNFVSSLEVIPNPKYPNLIDNLLDEREDSSWGMSGKIYKFKLNEYLKNILHDIGIANFLYLDDEKKFLLQNTTLLKNKEVMYSVCTHENFDEFEENFKNELASICKETLCSSDIYKELLEKNKNTPKEQLEKNIQILSDLCAYINKEINAHIYVMPKNEDVMLDKYIDITNNTLSNDICAKIINITSFKDFISPNFQHTREFRGEIINNSVNPFDDISPLAHDILDECKYLYALINFEK